jgi:hypothetical protein
LSLLSSLSLTEQSLSQQQLLSLTEQLLSQQQSLSLTEQSLSLTEQSLSLVRMDQSLEAPTQNHSATPKAPPQPTIGQQTAAPNAPQSHQQPTRTRQRSKQTSNRQSQANHIHQPQTQQLPISKNP